MSEQQVLPEFATLKAAAEPTRAQIEHGRDLSEIGSWLRCSTETQRTRLMAMLRRPLVPDLDEVKANVEVLIFERNSFKANLAASREEAAELRASLAQSEAERERLQGENIKLLNDASVWRNRAIGAEEEIREGGRGIDLRRGFER